MLLRQTLLYLPAQVVGPLFQLVSVVVWTHVVDARAVGIVTLVTAAAELLQTVGLAWWSQYALRFLGRYRGEDRTRYLATENGVLLWTSVLQAGAMFLALRLTIAPDADVVLVAAAVGCALTRSWSLYVAERARVSGHVLVYSIQQVGGPAGGLLLGLLLVQIAGRGPEWVLFGYAAAQAAAVAVAMPMTPFGRRIGPFDRGIVHHALGYGVPLIAGGALGWIGLNAPRFIVGEVTGVAAAGLFAVGYGLGQRAAAVAAMLVTAAAFPLAVRRMEEGDGPRAMRQLGDNGALLTAVLLPSVVGLIATSESIVRALIAEPFRDATLVILPLSAVAGGLRNLRVHFVDQAFLLHGRTRISLIVNAAEAAAALIFGVVGVAVWGLVGAAAASVGAAVLGAAVSLPLAIGRCELKMPMRHVARAAVATATMAGLLFADGRVETAVGVAGQVLAGVVAYAATLALLYVPDLAMRRSARIASTEDS